MKIDSSEFSATAVTGDQLVSWPRVAAVSAMIALSLPTFITGLEVFRGLPPAQAFMALVIGSLIVFFIGAVMGTIGTQTRLNSYLLVRVAFGEKGAGIVNIAFAISLIGWFGVGINLFTDAMNHLFVEVFGYKLPVFAMSVFASICMAVLTFTGFKVINLLATLMTPILIGITGLMIYSALQTHSLGEMFTDELLTGGSAQASFSTGDGISAVVGTIIVGAIIVPDFTRFSRHWTGAIYTCFIAYVMVQLFVMTAAGMAGTTSESSDIVEVMLGLGLGYAAFAIVMAGSWFLNALNLYSAVLSTKATFPKLGTSLCVVALAIIGVGAALLDILDHFIVFLVYLSIAFVPVAGVIIIDFFFIRRSYYSAEALTDGRRFAGKAFVAWAFGAAISIAASKAVIPKLSGIAALDAMAAAAVLYLLIAWGDREQAGQET